MTPKVLVGNDQAALRELSAFLSAEQLYFGIPIPSWSDELARNWEDTYVAEMEGIQARHALGTNDAPYAGPTYLEDELNALIHLTLKGAGDRRVNAIVRFFGFDGTGKKTLEEVGQQFGVTRERIRQITSNFARRLQGRNVYLPIFRLACNHIIENLPEVATNLGQLLRQQHLTKADFDISGIAAIAGLLDEEEPFDIISIGKAQLAIRKGISEHCIQVPRIARAISSAFGCGHIEHVLGDLEIRPEQAVAALEVAKVLGLVPDLQWLDQPHQWFYDHGS